VLLAGDGDYKDAIEWIRNFKNKNIWLLTFDGSVAGELKALFLISLLLRLLSYFL